MNKLNHYRLASSLVLLAFLFGCSCASAQIPKLFLKFVKEQNKVKSGYVKEQSIAITDNDTVRMHLKEFFFISTQKDLKYLTYYKTPYDSNIYCKIAHAEAVFYRKIYQGVEYDSYRHYKINDAKSDEFANLDFSTALGFSVDTWEGRTFQRIPPKFNKKNIRYKINSPDDDVMSEKSFEYEFDRKTFNLIQEEYSALYFKMERMYAGGEILEQQLYKYIHPEILDTISFMFEELKKRYEQQCAVEQSKKDSIFLAHFCDSITQYATTNNKWADMSQNVQQDTLSYMPKWNFPLLSGKNIDSDSIRSQFILIDMWYISCHPCRMAMRELSSIDTIYDESLLKMISINVFDEDTAKINQVIQNLNLKCDVALAYHSDDIVNLSKKMGNCQGFPQLYLIDMKTKQVVWHSCGYYKGFTKDVEKMIAF